MAKQLRSLGIGFNPRVDYDFHSDTTLKASIQFFSTALFILLISLTLGTYWKTLWNSACRILLPTKSDFKKTLSPTLPCLTFFLLCIYHLRTVYNSSFILLIVCLSSLLYELHKGRTFCLFHSLLYFCQQELCLVYSK